MSKKMDYEKMWKKLKKLLEYYIEYDERKYKASAGVAYVLSQMERYEELFAKNASSRPKINNQLKKFLKEKNGSFFPIKTPQQIIELLKEETGKDYSDYPIGKELLKKEE